MNNQRMRWQQRFANFEKARQKFHYALKAFRKDANNELYRMALIQTFEFTYELGWKTMKDFLRYEGVDKVSLPRDVIKQGFHYQIIEDGQAWMNMLDDRNLMAHAYDERKAERAVEHITQSYVQAIDQVYRYFKEKIAT